jgi:hypothetical protein
MFLETSISAQNTTSVTTQKTMILTITLVKTSKLILVVLFSKAAMCYIRKQLSMVDVYSRYVQIISGALLLTNINFMEDHKYG